MISFKQYITENFLPPKQGSTGGAPTKWKKGTNIIKTKMTLDEILNSKDIIQSTIPYYKDVIEDWDNKKYTWNVFKQVLKYAKFMKNHSESLKHLPPIQFVDNGLADGAHRISAIYLLQKRLDPNNPFWKNLKLRVEFGNKEDDLER